MILLYFVFRVILSAVISQPHLLSVSSGVVRGVWCYWTLLEARVGQTSRQTPRLNLTDKDPLPPPALQLQPHLLPVGAQPELHVVNLHCGLVCSVDINVHRGPGALWSWLAGQTGQSDDCFSERLSTSSSDYPLSHHVTLSFSL